VSFLSKSFFLRQSPIVPFGLAGTLLLSFLATTAHAQTGSSSSSDTTPGATISKDAEAKPAARIAQPEAGGSAITLETSEPVFDIAVALNVCGYDADLAASSPVRLKIRDELNAEVAASAPARASRDALCDYVRLHTLTDSSLNLAQYVSLALYLSPLPELTPIVSETELPPDSTQVVNILPLLRAFATDVHLHAIWVEHRPEYEALLARVHDPVTKMILDTNIYLRLPVSSYDGRRFLVLLEPMLAPSTTNARIYSSDYIVVASPAGDPLGAVHMNDIRHIYLHYEVEPLVYARASAMERLQPLLKSVQDAPLEFTYKSEIVPLITECLIKAIEAKTMDVSLAKPQKPTVVKERADLERYDAEMSVYEHEAEATRRKAVDLDMRQGWILADYFYNQIGEMEKESVSLKEDIGQMVYGMDVDHERHNARQIAFLPQGSSDVLRRAPRQLTGLQLAEMKIFKGDLAGATDIANQTLADPQGDHAQAHYVLARVNLMQSQPGAAIGDFQQVLDTSKDPRTLAWSHIYLGRLYDVNQERPKAVAEYQAALQVRDAQPDTKVAAETGLKQPFTAPKVEHQAPNNSGDSDDAPLDPSGKAEKEAYRPPPPPQ
jgi:tetratricopeptide (TPR) repeat protein